MNPDDNLNPTNIEAPIESVINEANPLTLDLDDKTFVGVVDELIKNSRAFFKEKKLYERRESNAETYLGRQVGHREDKGELNSYEARYQDNVVYEAEGVIKATAISRVPDLIVYPSDDSNKDAERLAELLTDAMNSRLKKRAVRKTLGLAYKHRPVYFVGVLKARWDSEKGKHGDYTFDCVHPDNIDVDHTATSNNVDDMQWVAHHYPMTIKEIIMKWPNKKTELLKMLGWDAEAGEDEKKLASKIKVSEIWFTWYTKNGDSWERVEATAWKFKTLVFEKIKHPYWDWEGETQTFRYDNELGKKVRVNEQDIRQSLITGTPITGMSTDQIYFNYLETPRKPFFFMGYDQLGLQPFDETTRIEQVKYLQENVNLRGKQISEMVARSRGKDVYSELSGLTADDVEKIDPRNPDQSILVKGSLRDVYSHIPGEQPSQSLYQEQSINRERLFSKMGTNAALRGVREGDDAGVRTQLFKESDFSKIDDEVEDTINAAAEWMAQWSMQFIRLFYTEAHMVKVGGSKGKTAYLQLTRDFVEDGMVVEVSSSAVDKIRRKREAFELAKMKMIDPVQFFKDIEVPDPEGRAEAMFLFQTQPNIYFQKYIRGRETTQDMASALVPPEGNQQTPPTGGQQTPPLGQQQPIDASMVQQL